MAYRKKFTKLGNSAAIVIDKAIMELLGMDNKSSVEISIGPDGKSLILRPVEDEEDDRRRFEKARKQSIAQYGKAYKKLADR
jgi:antitoxin component of MazEF toxin-antitoxin module